MSGFTELGQIAELVGIGSTGRGSTGYDFHDNVRRGGLNRLDSTFVNTFGKFPGWTAGFNALLIDFDDGSAAHDALSLFGYPDRGTGTDEVFTATGDSGAPALLGGRIAGTVSFATRVIRSDGSSPDVDLVLNRSFGEVAGLTRISRYQDWLAATTVVPEPGSGLLACIALIGIFSAKASRNDSQS